MTRNTFTFLEFFAGGGMARIGLGDRWRCAFANDFDAAKRAAYGENFGLDHHRGGDIHALALDALPAGVADLAWASSPCQDLSLAGARAGLGGGRSGAYFGFWRLIERLDDDGRAPRAIIVENVTGLITSNGGADFTGVVERLAARGYVVGAMVVNAACFVPQSRPRLFVIAWRDGPPPGVTSTAAPGPSEHLPAALIENAARLSPAARRRWRWLSPRPPAGRNLALADIIDPAAPFDAAAVTQRIVAAMSERQRANVRARAKAGGRHVGAAFRRVRVENGEKIIRIEARFDDLAGCIRTPAGGSSRQIIFVIDDGRVRTRLMTPREAARAMGLDDDYRLPAGATAALKLIGDGVCPPVVGWLAQTFVEPALVRARLAA